MGKPHKWMDVIRAWARGETIQQRVYDTVRTGNWGPWVVMPEGVAPMRTDMYCEYRVLPKVEPHKWQREKEAFLSGLPVQFRSTEHGNDRTWDGAWRNVEQYLVDHCNQTQCPAKQEVIPLWDRDWLEFRIKEELTIREGRVVLAERGHTFFHFGQPNVRFTFKNGELADTQVLRA